MRPLLTIATLNVANLHQESDPLRITQLAKAIHKDLNSPHLIALQEIGQKTHSPIVSPPKAEVGEMILKALTIEKPEIIYRFSEIPPLPFSTGGAESLHIRSAFLYRSPLRLTKLSLLGEDHPAFTGGESPIDNKKSLLFSPSRRLLHGQFSFFNQELHIINCHLKSMNAPTKKKSKIAKKQRHAQATYLTASILPLVNSFPILILGDLNDYPQSKTLAILQKSSSFQSLWHKQTQSCYTYLYRKRPVLLDYILFNTFFTLAEKKILHLNTPFIRESNVINNQAFSDHDPVFSAFTLK